MSDNNPRILVVEDEPPLKKLLDITLRAQKYEVIESSTGENAILQAATAQPDLIILDLGLPDIDGLVVIQRLREWSAIPIIVLTARGKEQDKINALDRGADDYLTKPFSVGELLARVRVILRHLASADKDTGESSVDLGAFSIDLARRIVTKAGQEVHLTPNEYRLLTVLLKNRGKVMTHRQLLKEVWGPDSTYEHHYLRVYINQLRQKLEADPANPAILQTETGVGYRLRGEVESE